VCIGVAATVGIIYLLKMRRGNDDKQINRLPKIVSGYQSELEVPIGSPSGSPSQLPRGLPSELPRGLPSELPRGLPSELPRGLPRGLPRNMPPHLQELEGNQTREPTELSVYYLRK